MKKQLYRVKQLADQRVGRAEKTDILNEELQQVEKSVEKIKISIGSTSKKLGACMQSNGPDLERRKRKLNQMALAQGMLEGATQLSENPLLSGVFLTGGETQSALAGELANCEMAMDENVLLPMAKLLETDIPSIIQSKKKLTKAGLDMDACRTRYLNAVKQSHAASKDMVAAANKVESLKQDLEDEKARFESAQDSLVTEMYSFVAREKEFAEWVIKLMEAQLVYHRECFNLLERALPGLKAQVEDSMFRPVYGCPLEDHLRVNDREIAFVLEECILFLLEIAMETEGLFRLTGSSSKLKKLRASFDAGIVDMSEYVNDVHAVTGALKQYLRELPEPLLTFRLYNEWINANSISDRDARLQALWTVNSNLPPANKNNLRYLICFLSKLAENAEITKMSSQNIAIVMSPNLIWADDEESFAVQHAGNITAIVDTLIQHCSWFYPEGADFRSSNEDGPDSAREKIAARPYPKQGSQDVSPEVSLTGGLLSEVTKLLNLNPSSSSPREDPSPGLVNAEPEKLSPRPGRRAPPPPLPIKPPPGSNRTQSTGHRHSSGSFSPPLSGPSPNTPKR